MAWLVALGNEGTYNDAVVTLRRLNLELILKKKTSGCHRGSKAAKDLQNGSAT